MTSVNQRRSFQSKRKIDCNEGHIWEYARNIFSICPCISLMQIIGKIWRLHHIRMFYISTLNWSRDMHMHTLLTGQANPLVTLLTYQTYICMIQISVSSIAQYHQTRLVDRIFANATPGWAAASKHVHVCTVQIPLLNLADASQRRTCCIVARLIITHARMKYTV